MQFNEKNIKTFECNDLAPYIDSMLFDSGETIAYMGYEDEELFINIYLEVRGEVRIEADGEIFKYPSVFPDWVVDIIKNNGLFDDNDRLFVIDNNWFEYMFDVTYRDGGKSYSDGSMCEWDISKGTPEDIKKDMIDIVKYIKENNGG